MKFRTWFGLFFVLPAILLSGCQSVKKALDLNTTAVLEISAAADINPDFDGRPSPVVLHVFKLADDRQFRRQDFLGLYESAAARLGKDLIGSVVLKEITPGESRQEIIKLTPEVKYLGVMAEFSQYRDADAIIVLPVLEHNKNSFAISVNGISITEPQPDAEEESRSPGFQAFKKEKIR